MTEVKRWRVELYPTAMHLQSGGRSITVLPSTAYAILRHNGVDIGNKDFLGELPYRD